MSFPLSYARTLSSVIRMKYWLHYFYDIIVVPIENLCGMSNYHHLHNYLILSINIFGRADNENLHIKTLLYAWKM